MNANTAELPPLTTDYFQFLGIDRRLNLDESELQRRFYDLSRRLHPDRFTQRSSADQQYSLDATALLNDAFRTLKDPIRRSEYLLKQEGFDIGEQRSADVPPELLEEVFELNMALEEMRGGDTSARKQLESAHSLFKGMLAKIGDEISEQFATYDRTSDKQALQTLRSILNRRRYISNLFNEVEKTLAS